jgi:PAS domain S-box-containing protein
MPHPPHHVRTHTAVLFSHACPAPACTHHTLSIIQDVNQNLWILYGYSREELLGKKINMLMCSPHAHMHDTYLRRT